MKTKKLLILLLAGALTLSACSKTETPKKAKEGTVTEQVEGKDVEKVEVGYTFMIDSEGKIVKDAKSKTIIDVYFDPSCPSCQALEEYIANDYTKSIPSKAVFRYNPVAFMVSQGNSHSLRAASAMQLVAQINPDIAPNFIKEVMTQKTQLASMSAQDYSVLKEIYEKLGGKDWKKIETNLPEAEKVIDKKTDVFVNNKDLERINGGRLVTPMIINLKAEKAVDLTKGEVIKDAVENIME